ncbi:Ig-like domain-containing protein [Pseudomonas brassicacearum]|jgi:hypothetical protein|uniref:BIG2 domain-containing protein n=1 Tax=Pseudomonas brassicacearum TaxID=930166 RepID=A0A423JV07_9PSED|nr:Ig-like domain-containing protein [Pseudomonas brassicacearum]RON41519.1 hypothetical protein BK664_02945 [Pseudomonas brassicacearum]
MFIATATLREPSVDEAPDGVLDPETLPAEGATVRIKPYVGMAFRDHVYLFIGDHYTDDIPIGASAVGKDVAFTVATKEFVASTDNIVPIRYEVQPYQGALEESLILNLQLNVGFEGNATLDLSTENYVASVEKTPTITPAFIRMSREANWGAPPYEYTSSEEDIATVDKMSGEVTAKRNGLCSITATDSQHQARSYALTIKGIQELHFLSPGADWDGMKVLCMAANLQPVTLTQIKRLWSLYYPSSGAVADYLDWLNYPVWTANELGAGTAWSYDLNGPNVNENASSDAMDTLHQIVGIKQS